jgi:hypothetical protein
MRFSFAGLKRGHWMAALIDFSAMSYGNVCRKARSFLPIVNPVRATGTGIERGSSQPRWIGGGRDRSA